MFIKVPTRPCPPEIAAMPTTTPEQADAKYKAINDFFANVMFIQTEVPQSVVDGGKAALDAFQAQCEADALGLSPIPATPAPTPAAPVAAEG